MCAEQQAQGLACSGLPADAGWMLLGTWFWVGEVGGEDQRGQRKSKNKEGLGSRRGAQGTATRQMVLKDQGSRVQSVVLGVQGGGCW